MKKMEKMSEHKMKKEHEKKRDHEKRKEHEKKKERHEGIKKKAESERGMMDNRMVKGDHQEGIKRVLQRKGDLDVGQGGKMNAKGSANWKRPDRAMTPREA